MAQARLQAGPAKKASGARSLSAFAGSLALAMGVFTLALPVAGSASAQVTSTTAGQALAPSHQAGLFEDLEYLSGSALQSRLDQFAATGVRWARFQMLWGTIQAAGPSSYDWGNYDAVVQGLLARDIQPLIVVDTSPTWDRVAGCSVGLICAPASPGPYASFVAAAAARYAPMGANHWEVWNEPNNDGFWAPAPNPAAYTALLQGAYGAIKGVDPAATVLTGGLAPAITPPGPNPITIAPVDFLSDIYNDGAGGSFDAVAWHPYTFPALPGAADPGSAWYQMYGTATSARSLMVDHGDGAKQLWVTEFGAQTDAADPTSVTPGVQAEMFTQALALWPTYPWAGPFIGYQYQDMGTNAGIRGDFFGMVDASGTPKPALGAFETAIATLALTATLPTATLPTATLPTATQPTTAQLGATAPAPAATPGLGYRLVASDGGVFSFGNAPFLGSLRGSGAAVSAMATTAGGYWLATPGGTVQGFGSAQGEPQSGGDLTAAVVAMASTPDAAGYWLVAADGSVASYGDAPYNGSLAGRHLVGPIVGAASSADGKGYWLVAADGGMFAFGDAPFDGSIGGHVLNKPVVGMAALPDGLGYWEVAADGGVFSFGQARFFGSTGGMRLNRPVVGMAATPNGEGYWMDASDGGVFAFGDAPFEGSTGSMTLVKPVIAMSAG